MKNKKLGKILAGVTSLALVAAISVGATLAYMTAHAEVKNTFTFGNVAIELHEDAWTNSSSHVIAPNTSLAKDPTVENTGANEAWVRVKLTYNSNVITLNGVDTTEWSKDGDYYYYNTTLENKDALAGKTTTPLFTGFTMNNLNNTTLSSLADADKDIDVVAQAIQADGIADLAAAKAAFAATPVGDFQ